MGALLVASNQREFSLDLYRQWEKHPFTEVLIKILKEYRDDVDERNYVMVGSRCEEVALKVAEHRGKCRLLDKLIEKDEDSGESYLKEFLDDYIEWVSPYKEEINNA